MGASLIGHNCDRYIWLTWRWALKPEFKGRILRLFDTGKREESRLIEELRGIGATVWDVDPDSGDQWRVSACNGHFGGSLDGGRGQHGGVHQPTLVAAGANASVVPGKQIWVQLCRLAGL